VATDETLQGHFRRIISTEIPEAAEKGLFMRSSAMITSGPSRRPSTLTFRGPQWPSFFSQVKIEGSMSGLALDADPPPEAHAKPPRRRSACLVGWTLNRGTYALI
jgi:hypothetical protein